MRTAALRNAAQADGRTRVPAAARQKFRRRFFTDFHKDDEKPDKIRYSNRMNNAKMLSVMILFIAVGLVFIAAGLVFNTDSYLKKIAEAAGADEIRRKNAVRAGRVCGYTAVGLGALTVVCGLTARLCFPVFQYMALVYVIALVAAFAVIMAAVRKK